MSERLSDNDLRVLDRANEENGVCWSPGKPQLRSIIAELRARRAADLSAEEVALIDTALGHLASDVPPYDRAPKAGEVEALRNKLTKGAR